MATLATERAGAPETPIVYGTSSRRDWKGAWVALRKLLSDSNDTVQAFRIMRALNADTPARQYRKLLQAPGGGRIAYRRVELSERFSDPNFIASFAPGTVGAAYRDFLGATGYTAMGLADVSEAQHLEDEMEHPYGWIGRRERDVHDIWHVLTGYQADEPLGESCLIAFSYAQTDGLGWAVISGGAALKSLRITGESAFLRAVWEGYRNGKRADWLSGEDYEQLLHEPLADARKRLNIPEPVRYHQARKRLAEQGLTGL
ncbi:ubiquinone biosynthesis protein [Sphingomonas sp. MAH-20]|jgi:ubiquinone biosynthesis protein COQ4|uniref:Ubiquinone biosynthesis protein n=1 Tax=Sphingomonas horti TaxID=2682842 RepID=A0A6I4J584_9SPHN|nr:MULTISPECIES: Coq4 family protein [Sphingomonas]MBA2919250.1 ubiquinone biosynthesis protein [Sphingomonas sp. CGMCC 1.13658]MVO79283.1 ubiquinone biosynthesis protein [Sphingomonas horti]